MNENPEVLDKAREMVLLLSQEMNVPPCPVFFRPRKTRGSVWAYYWKGAIWLNTQESPGTIERTILHEFAHHIDAQTALLTPRPTYKRRSMHGPRFFFILKKVCAGWYKDVSRYPWVTEYPAIVKRAQKAGLCPTDPDARMQALREFWSQVERG